MLLRRANAAGRFDFVDIALRGGRGRGRGREIGNSIQK
jgi:hypothetical protein